MATGRMAVLIMTVLLAYPMAAAGQARNEPLTGCRSYGGGVVRLGANVIASLFTTAHGDHAVLEAGVIVRRSVPWEPGEYGTMRPLAADSGGRRLGVFAGKSGQLRFSTTVTRNSS